MNTYSVAAQLKAVGADKFVSDFNNASKSVQGFVRDNDKAFASMRTVGKAAMAGGLAIGAGLGYAIKTSADFEQQMSRVKAISGASAKEMDKLSDSAEHWGATTAFTSVEVGQAQEFMAQAGWEANQILDATGGLLSLAAAGNLELGEAAQIVTGSLNAFSLEADFASQASDILAYASANSGADVAELGESLSYSATSMSEANMSYADGVAALGLLADNQIKGSRAGTVMNAVLRDIRKSAEDGSIAIGDTAVAVYDAGTGAFRPFADILGDVEEATKGMTDEQRDAALEQVFQQQSLQGMNILLDEGADKYRNFTNELDNSTGSAEAMREELENNLYGQLAILGSGLNQLAKDIGDVLVPYVKMAVKYVQKLTNWFNALSDTTKKVIAITAAIASVVLTVGGAFLILVGMLPMIVAGFGHVAAVFGLVKVALVTFAGPIAIVVAAIAGLVAAGIYLYQNWETVKSKMVDIFSNFKPLFDNLKDSVSNLKSSMQPAIESLKSAWDGLKPVLLAVGQIIGGVLVVQFGIIVSIVNGVINAIGPLIETFAALIDFVTNVVAAIVKLFMGDFSGALEHWNAAAEASVNFFIGLFETVWGFVEGLVTGIIDFFHGLYMTLVGNSIIPDMVEAIVEWFTNMFEWLIEIVSNIVTGVVDFFTNLYETAVEIFTAFWEFITEIWDYISETFENALDFILALVDGDFEGMKDAIENQMENAKEFLSNVWGIIKGLIGEKASEILTNIIKRFIEIKDNIKEKITSAKDALVNRFTEMVSNTKNKVQEILRNIINKFIEIKNNITNKITGAKTALVNKFTEMVTGAKNKAQEIVTTAKEKFEAVKQGIKDKLAEAVTVVGEKIGEMPGKVMEFFGDMVDVGKHLVAGLINGIKQMGKDAIEAVTGVVGGVVDKAKGLLKIESPSKVFEEMGEFTGEGFIGGIISMTKGVAKAAKDMVGASMVDVEPINIGSRVNSINRQAERQLSHTFDSNINVNNKQPAYINVSIGNRDFEGFVDDISEVQDRNTMLQKAFS